MKNKKIFKILSILMVVIFVAISINLSSFASIKEGESDTSSITITGLEADVSVYIYQLTTVNYDYESDGPYDPEYVWVEEIQNWITSNYPNNINDDGSVSEDFNVEDVTTATGFYSELISAIRSGSLLSATDSISGTESTKTVTVELSDDEETKSVTFTGLEMGTYLIVTENGLRVYTPVVVNLVPEYDDDEDSETYGEWVLNAKEVDCKSTSLTITKTVYDDETTSEVTQVNYSTADTLNYTIITDVPTYESNSISYTYKITDSLDEGLTLDEDSIRVYGIDSDTSDDLATHSSETEEITNSDGNYYTLTYTYDDDNKITGYTLEFSYSEIADYEQIKVTYDAELNQDSSLVISDEENVDTEDSHILGNENTATLIYSNDPYESNSVEEISAEVVVYTYGIDITKISEDLDDDGNKVYLAGAEFELQDSDENALYFVLVDGVYYLAESTDDNATTTLVTASGGKLYIYGLDEGTYYLQETKAPEDYILDTKAQTIVIKDSDPNGLLDVEDETTETGYSDSADGIYYMEVENITGFSLPLTGGVGSILFVLAGVVLIIIGIFIDKKKNKKEIN